MDVTGISVEKAEEIEDASIVSGAINEAGHLILQNHGGDLINAGRVVPYETEIRTYLHAEASGGVVWTKPEWAAKVRIILIGGGAGGKIPIGHGKGGAVFDLTLSADKLDATETVTVTNGGRGQQGGGVPLDALAGGYARMTIGGVQYTAEGGYLAGDLNPDGGPLARVVREAVALTQSESFRFGGGATGGAGDGTDTGYYGFVGVGEDGDVPSGIPGGGGNASSAGGFPGGGGGASGGSNAGAGGAAVACVISYSSYDLT